MILFFVNNKKFLLEIRKVFAICTQRMVPPIESSTGRASICLSTGRASTGLPIFCPLTGDAWPLLSPVLAFVVRPLLKRRNDSLRDFFNDFRREMGPSPAPDRSEIVFH